MFKDMVAIEQHKRILSMISHLLLFWSITVSHALCGSEMTASRRDLFSQLTFITATIVPPPAYAASKVKILNTPSGVKYAVIKESSAGKSIVPQAGDFVAIEYTGYLSNGQIFDSTHSEGKGNALLFKLGSKAVIPGINDVIMTMKVGEKVQAIIPPSLAFGSEGVCLSNADGTRGDCLIPPDTTLVYDIALKKTAVPPP